MQTVRGIFGGLGVAGRLGLPSRRPRAVARLKGPLSAELDERAERSVVRAGLVWRGVGGPVRLGYELLLPYPGFCGFDGVCHVRVLEPLSRLVWRAPVVIVGALEDSPGTSITNVIEVVAAAVRREVFPDGRSFLLVEHYADRCRPAFSIVRFKRTERQPSHEIWAHLGRLRVQVGGGRASLVAPPGLLLSGFQEPSWYPVEHEELQARLGCQIKVWPVGEYTAQTVAGSAGRQLVELVRARGSDLRLPLAGVAGGEVR